MNLTELLTTGEKTVLIRSDLRNRGVCSFLMGYVGREYKVKQNLVAVL